jgi:hypothetical protein
MRARTQLIATVAACTGGGSLAIGIGQLMATDAAQAKVSRTYTVRVGDRVLVPSVGQQCSVYTEGGSPELYCVRLQGPRHQVSFYRDIIFVWKVGDPDHPAWSGKP